jgi:formylglycine-generating enzyme required for sulfatase activity
VFRGGAWRSWPAICRAACRSADEPELTDDYLGFRAALTWTRELAVTAALG